MNRFLHKILREGKSLFFCLSLFVVVLPCVNADATRAKAGKSVSKNQTSSSFDKPDFAFPKTVEKNAAERYEKALREGNPQEALRAAMQLSVAGALVSADSFQETAARFSRLRSLLPTPYSNLAALLEARCYLDFYNSNRYVFDRRSIPLDSLPSNTSEWSGEMFRASITKLAKEAVANGNSGAGILLSQISGILVNDADAVRARISIADFIDVQAADILNVIADGGGRNQRVIPFFVGYTEKTDDKMDRGVKLLDDAISRHPLPADAEARAMLCELKMNMLSGDARKKYAAECRLDFDSTRYAAPFLIECVNSHNSGSDIDERNAAARKDYEILNDYLRRWPDAYLKSQLQDRIAMMARNEVDIEMPQQVLPGSEFQATVQFSNLYSFHLNVYRIPYDFMEFDSTVRYSDLKKSGKLVASIPVSHNGSTPDRVRKAVVIPGMESGLYAIVPARSADASDFLVDNPKMEVSTLLVSGITVVESCVADGQSRIYVVDASNQHPIEGAKVKYGSQADFRNNKCSTAVTDVNGLAILQGRYGRLFVESGADRFDDNYSGGYKRDGAKEKMMARVLTNLSLLRPGENLEFAGALYKGNQFAISAFPEAEANVKLMNANWQEVDSVSVKADEFGRVSGAFSIPKSGLLGKYTIVLSHDGEQLAYASVDVADYVAPTFIVDLKSNSVDFSTDDEIRFDGEVISYSGVPMADAKVEYSVVYSPPFRRWNEEGGASYVGSAMSGDDGKFSIMLPASALKNTPFELGQYTITATATSAAGESQKSAPIRFSIGNERSISLSSLPGEIEVGNQNLPIKVDVLNIAGNPIVSPVYYRILNSDGVAEAGEFQSPNFSPNLKKLKSGKYDFQFSLTSEFPGNEKLARDSVVVYRASDAEPPYPTPLWLPSQRIEVDANQKSAKVKVGSSYADSWILAMIYDSEGNASEKWLKVSNGFVSLDVEAPDADSRTYVNLVGTRNLSSASGNVEIIPRKQMIPLEVKTITFRDKITPGEQEQWQFIFSFDGKPQSRIPVMAVMSDKALNAVSPFKWSFNPYGELNWHPSGYYFSTASVGRISNDYYASLPRIAKPSAYMSMPDWQTYGYSLFPIGRNGGMRFTRKAMKSEDGSVEEVAVEYAAAPILMASVESKASAVNALADLSSDSGESVFAGGVVDDNESEHLRQSELPIAFFKPDLITNSDGMAEISFKAPDFVGTWQFQLAAYTPDMRGVVVKKDIVSAKRVMAKLNSPRFVRSGDMLSVSASLFNNADVQLPLSGRIEFFLPSTGQILSSERFVSEKVPALGSRVVTATLRVPQEISELGVRIYAETDGNSDGEQTLVAVLPASTPIVESTPFWLGGAKGDITKRLPKYPESARITLSYCDNPVWECVTTLPALVKPQSVSILSHADALYGSCVTQGILTKYPVVRDGLIEMGNESAAGDSSLVSQLNRHGELKLFDLNSTPWVNDSASSTARMAALAALAKSGDYSSLVNEQSEWILANQNADGGWGWCPGMESSDFASMSVLSKMGDLNSMGYLPEVLFNAAEKGFKYMDKSIVADWKKYKSFDTVSMLKYLYARSAFKNIKSSGEFSSLEASAIKVIKRDWRKFDISDKAMAAMVLNRRGNGTDARVVLESLRQFSSESEEKGVWFDNLTSPGNAVVLTTGIVLKAFAEIEPENMIVNGLRQNLVLSRQSLAWNDSRALCGVVDALLSSGSDWTVETEAPQIMIGNRLVSIPHISSRVGSFCINLDAEEASESLLTVSRSASSPAWGGVIAQYQQPVQEVKAAGIPGLCIEKHLYLLREENGALVASKADAKEVSVGQRVRVSLVVTVDRDIDYLAISDSRAACLSPDIQLSGFAWSDGVGFYREVRDDTTNLFLPRLQKGTHVISYDCRVDREGVYSVGIASAQSQQSPELTAHSAGAILRVASPHK